ncbi:stage V sporulation protein K [Desulfurispora thermophila]|uniref:stage V sporulation protein K n=1 Tax=Desulfurispora thermophila TaxID=265470 RepID=UPI000382DDC1|nr:stage V sporulation protein K [Desulfurispora thermophila]
MLWSEKKNQLALDKTKHDSEQQRQKNIKTILNELERLVGLQEVKQAVKEIYAWIEIQKKRQKERLATESQVLHMIFKGNPGTGKTTVARLLGQLFKEMGVLPKGHLVEVERADLVGEYIGHTAQRTREAVKKALGGILFVDEAYSLARGGEKDFGKESIDVLVKQMEDQKDAFILILAGYNDEMEWFLETNPGLRSRFPIQIRFPDYNLSELLAIADVMLQQKQYVLNSGAREELRTVLQTLKKSHINSGNARLVRNIIEAAIRQQAVRLLEARQVSREDLLTITREDLVRARQKINIC